MDKILTNHILNLRKIVILGKITSELIKTMLFQFRNLMKIEYWQNTYCYTNNSGTKLKHTLLNIHTLNYTHDEVLRHL